MTQNTMTFVNVGALKSVLKYDCLYKKLMEITDVHMINIDNYLPHYQQVDTIFISRCY